MTVREQTCPIMTSARDGFIIVAVLWILAALAALAINLFDLHQKFRLGSFCDGR